MSRESLHEPVPIPAGSSVLIQHAVGVTGAPMSCATRGHSRSDRGAAKYAEGELRLWEGSVLLVGGVRGEYTTCATSRW